MQESRKRHIDMDDLVFENRNKAYGAFVLRKGYSRLLAKALVIAISGFLLLILMPYIIDLFHKEPAMDMNMVQVEEIPIQVNEVPNLAPPSPPPPLENTKPKIAPVVTKDSTEEKPPQKNDTAQTARADKGKMDSTGTNKNALSGNGEDTGKVFFYTDYPPSFPGGEEQMHAFIRNSFKYPTSALPKISSASIFTVIVERDGRLTIEKINHNGPVSQDLEDEAIRVVKSMPRWYPGRDLKRNAVRIRVRFAINFPKKN